MYTFIHSHNTYAYTHHVERPLRQEALMCCVELLLPGKVPTADVVLVTVTRAALLLQVTPLLHCDSHRSYVGFHRG